jgi:hypothetical protein
VCEDACVRGWGAGGGAVLGRVCVRLCVGGGGRCEGV